MEKIYNGLIGLVVGDAVGAPVEFLERDSYHLTGMVGYGTHNLDGRQLYGSGNGGKHRKAWPG